MDLGGKQNELPVFPPCSRLHGFSKQKIEAVEFVSWTPTKKLAMRAEGRQPAVDVLSRAVLTIDPYLLWLSFP